MKNSVLVIVSMALTPCWAFAQNGVVLINQSTVAPNRLPPGVPAPPFTGSFPVKITQPGSYQLSGNLMVPAGVSGIQISASFVSLDLNGFNISCVGDCSGSAGNGIADDGTPHSGITIRNGTIVGFFFGIDLGSSTGSFIEKVTTQSNRFVGIALGDGSIIKNCFILNNGGDGIAAGVHGIVSDSVVSGNAGLNAAPATSTRLLFVLLPIRVATKQVYKFRISAWIPQSVRKARWAHACSISSVPDPHRHLLLRPNYRGEPFLLIP
jgi:hypothetical protein